MVLPSDNSGMVKLRLKHIAAPDAVSGHACHATVLSFSNNPVSNVAISLCASPAVVFAKTFT